jgi:hypothetical protein
VLLALYPWSSSPTTRNGESSTGDSSGDPDSAALGLAVSSAPGSFRLVAAAAVRSAGLGAACAWAVAAAVIATAPRRSAEVHRRLPLIR